MHTFLHTMQDSASHWAYFIEYKVFARSLELVAELKDLRLRQEEARSNDVDQLFDVRLLLDERLAGALESKSGSQSNHQSCRECGRVLGLLLRGREEFRAEIERRVKEVAAMAQHTPFGTILDPDCSTSIAWRSFARRGGVQSTWCGKTRKVPAGGGAFRAGKRTAALNLYLRDAARIHPRPRRVSV